MWTIESSAGDVIESGSGLLHRYTHNCRLHEDRFIVRVAISSPDGMSSNGDTVLVEGFDPAQGTVVWSLSSSWFAPTEDARVSRAVLWAVDAPGFEQMFNVLFVYEHPELAPTPEAGVTTAADFFDRTEALELLEAAGYSDGGPSLSVGYRTNDQLLKDIAAALVDDLQGLFDVTLEVVSFRADIVVAFSE